MSRKLLTSCPRCGSEFTMRSFWNSYYKDCVSCWYSAPDSEFITGYIEILLWLLIIFVIVLGLLK